MLASVLIVLGGGRWLIEAGIRQAKARDNVVEPAALLRRRERCARLVIARARPVGGRLFLFSAGGGCS